MDVVGGGRLREAATAPPTGERVHRLATAHGFTVEQILSGRLDGPVDDDQDHDEWVIVLEGNAVLEVAGDARTLAPGEWLLLPAHVPHRVLSTDAGTSWLAVRGERRDDDGHERLEGGTAR